MAGQPQDLYWVPCVTLKPQILSIFCHIQCPILSVFQICLLEDFLGSAGLFFLTCPLVPLLDSFQPVAHLLSRAFFP